MGEPMQRIRFASRTCRSRHAESGQVNIFLLLVLGIFFLAFIGLAVDYSNFWFHRRMAQGAADAACQAGAMDMLVNATTGSKFGGFPGGNFDCASNKTAAVCKYAELNGYPSATLTAGTPGTDVQVSFPGSVSGVTTPPAGLAPIPFIQVNVQDRVSTFFSGLLTGNSTQDVGASAVCGLQQAASPIPLLVLNPTCQHPFQVSGSATLKIVGGPNKSVEVNSSNVTCAAATVSSANSCNGNGTIDLSAGGLNFTGSTFGVFGAPGAPPTNFIPGTTGSWQSPSPPIADPFVQVPAPSSAALTVRLGPVPVLYPQDGCPDTLGCNEYLPGKYTSPIVVRGTTAIFVPGVYYIKPTSYPNKSHGTCGGPGSGCSTNPTGQCDYDFLVDSNGVVRPAGTLTTAAAIAAADTSHGVVIYLSGPGGGGAGSFGGVFFGADAGKAGGRSIASLASTALTCDGSNPDPKGKLGIPGLLDGDILLGQCTAGGTYVGTPSTDSVPGNLANATRGLIFFQDRANGDPNGQSNMQGGGGLAISGTIYAHDCPNNPTCSPATDYNAFVSLQGTPGSGTFVIGEIVADQVVEAGNGSIGMQLNPKAVLFVLKAELLQ